MSVPELPRALQRRDLDRVKLSVFGLVVVGLIARLAFLGQRIVHYDEGRVGYWTLHLLETGSFRYRFIIHGPFIQHVNAHMFGFFGADDFTLRVFVALVGAALPLTALLFREHLRDIETIALALFLTANPVLLYYSRFLRSTLLVAGFMFAAFGLFLRAYDTRRIGYVHAGVALVALGFTAKENAAVYLLTWTGAAALLIDHELFRPRESETGFDRLRVFQARTRRYLPRDPQSVVRYVGHVLIAVVVFLVIIVFFYAPRAGTAGGVGLWQAVGRPSMFPAVLDAMVDSIVDGYTYWFGGTSNPGCHKSNVIDGYICFLGRFLRTIASYAGPLIAFAMIGFVVERYGSDRPRNLVMFTSYWGFVSVLGYPLGADIYGAWITINAIIPLAIPAAVGLGLVYRWGRDAAADGDRIGAGVAGVVLLLVAGQVGVAAVNGVYLHPTADENDLVQYAQPSDNMRPTLRDIETLAHEHSGTDVLFYGSELTVENPRSDAIYPACSAISKTLPIQWYLALSDATAACAINETQLDAHLEDDPPPVIIARVKHRDALERRLDGYDTRVYHLRTSGPETVFFIDGERLAEADQNRRRRASTEARVPFPDPTESHRAVVGVVSSHE